MAAQRLATIRRLDLQLLYRAAGELMQKEQEWYGYHTAPLQALEAAAASLDSPTTAAIDENDLLELVNWLLGVTAAGSLRGHAAPQRLYNLCWKWWDLLEPVPSYTPVRKERLLCHDIVDAVDAAEAVVADSR